VIKELREDKEALSKHLSLQGLLLSEELEAQRRRQGQPRGELGHGKETFSDGQSSNVEVVQRRVEEKLRKDRQKVKREVARFSTALPFSSSRVPLQVATNARQENRQAAGSIADDDRRKRRRTLASVTPRR
jgi:hypothetical protein